MRSVDVELVPIASFLAMVYTCAVFTQARKEDFFLGLSLEWLYSKD